MRGGGGDIAAIPPEAPNKSTKQNCLHVSPRKPNAKPVTPAESSATESCQGGVRTYFLRFLSGNRS